jgi:hypothetical protein
MQLSTALIEQPNTEQPPKLVWSEAIKKFINNLTEAGRGNQVRNYKTAFKYYLESIDLTEDSPVGAEMGEECEDKIKIYIEFEITRKLQKSTYGPRVSNIRELKNFVHKNFASILRLQSLPKTFGQRLLKLIIALGHTVNSFARTLPEGLVSYALLLIWCNEKRLPTIKYLQVIGTLEEQLGVPTGTLSLPRYLSFGSNPKVGQSDSGNKIRAAISKPYRIWTEALEEVFQKLFIHKTMAVLPEGEERHDNGQWTGNENGEFPSADFAKKYLAGFFGFCSLLKNNPDPYLRGEGIKIEDLSFALLTVQDLVENYLTFMKFRSGLRVRPVDIATWESLPPHQKAAKPPHEKSAKPLEFYDRGGKYNNGSLAFLSMVSSLLRADTGYLYQHPEYSAQLGPEMTAAAWRKKCLRTRNRVEKIHKQISKMKKENDLENFEFGRDPKERIQWILDLPRPLLILHEMIKAMMDDLLSEAAPKLQRATQFRNLVLVSLLCANPLRINMFTLIEFDKHLIRNSDGSWLLRFKKGAFKNRKALKCDYSVGVASDLWPMLDRYREEFHPILAAGTGSKHVFIGNRNYRLSKRSRGALSATSLSNIIHDLTELYLPGDFGFRPHAFRHIIATDIIRSDPRFGFFMAAVALHDKLETVTEDYADLKTSELFEPVNTHFSEMWKKVFGTSLAEFGDNN